MRKLKDLENIREWPAKCENRECFLLCKFPIIQYYYSSLTDIILSVFFSAYRWITSVMEVKTHQDAMMKNLL